MLKESEQKILKVLLSRPMTVMELVRNTYLSEPTVRRYVKSLEKKRLVKVESDGYRNHVALTPKGEKIASVIS